MGIKPSQNGTLQTVEAGTTLNVAGTLQIAGAAVTTSAAELNILDGVTANASQINAAAGGTGTSVSFAPAAGGANVCEVTLTVFDGAGVAVAAVHNLEVWLSDAATGAGLTGTTASGTVTAKAASGVVLVTHTAKKLLYVQTLADGTFILEITDSAKTGFYVAATVPLSGKAAVSAQLVTGNYG